jgi:choline dehydrogenase-like flavoprotein
MRRLLRWLGATVYPSFGLPGGDAGPGASRFLEDLWREAPWFVALAHTLLALGMLAAPWFALRSWRLLPWLDAEGRAAALGTLLASPVYPIRLAAWAVRGYAMVAVLRDPAQRARLLPPGIDREAHDAPPPLVPALADLADEDGADFVIVGSGAAGAVAASWLAERGHGVLVLEEGPWRSRADFGLPVYGAMARLFREFGAQAARGRSVFPVMEGCCAGGSTVMNGAIVHRMPREVYDAWVAADAGLGAALPWARLDAHADAIETDLGVRANLEPVLPALPAARALDRLGWRYQAMRRTAPGCQGTGRCLQGCPSGGKLSMEASYLPRAIAAGARLAVRQRALAIELTGRRASAVRVLGPDGRVRRARARRAIVVAAGTVQSPLLLAASGLRGPHVGRHFRCHLGVGAVALLDRPVREVEGPPQGIEVLPDERGAAKLATQLVPPELVLARTPVVGGALAALLAQADRISSWTASVASTADGCVSPGWPGRAHIALTPAVRDLERLREGVHRMVVLFFALGARHVFPGVAGAPAQLADPGQAGLVLSAPLDPRGFLIGAGHLFGTCRMATDPRAGVVAPDFRHHEADGLYVIDASVFPTPVGVNPLLAIMTLARAAAEAIAGP